jgi:hypothetical protein
VETPEPIRFCRLWKEEAGAKPTARYYWLQLAEGYLTRQLFASMAHRIAALPVAAG